MIFYIYILNYFVLNCIITKLSIQLFFYKYSTLHPMKKRTNVINRIHKVFLIPNIDACDQIHEPSYSFHQSYINVLPKSSAASIPKAGTFNFVVLHRNPTRRFLRSLIRVQQVEDNDMMPEISDEALQNAIRSHFHAASNSTT